MDPVADHDAIVAAFHAHKDGQTKFTRRMAINIADHFGMRPMSLVWYLEKNRLLKKGSYDWFKHYGGITKANIDEARNTPPPPREPTSPAQAGKE